MSAFAVVYDRNNAPAHAGVLLRVMERLRHRGPDGSDTLITGQAALGHWHFWTTPEEAGERQPLQAEGAPFTIVLDGRLDNRSDLVSELGLDRAQGASLSDAALILRAYQRWGEGCFEHLIGEFALAIYDQARGRLVCARDALGDRVLYYSVRGERVVVASEPWAVAGADDSRVELDERAVAHHFALQTTADGQTLFKNVFEILPAQVRVFGETGQRAWKYWRSDPTRRLRGLSDREYAGEFLRLLDQSVRARMRSTTPVAVLMSGGLDSTSVASLAARMIAPEALMTVSYVFDELPECDERDYIQSMVERWGIRSIQIPCDDAWPYKDWRSWPFNPNQPEVNPYRWLKERAYRRTHEEGARVLLTGGFGDELYDRGEDWLDELVAEGRLRESARELGVYLRYAGLRWTLDAGFVQRFVKRRLKALTRGKLHRKPDMPDWLTSTSHRHVTQALAASYEHYGNLLGVSWSANGYSRETYFASLHAVDIRHPFHDRRLVEFVLGLPAYQLYYRGMNKIILRNAMRGLLPEKIRVRSQPTFMMPFFFRGVERENAFLQTRFHDPANAWNKYVKTDWVLERWNTPVPASKDGPRAIVPWLSFSYDSWYKASTFSN
ncbi:MAG: asparagine synthase-related protein [Chloroflexota bacterium]